MLCCENLLWVWMYLVWIIEWFYCVIYFRWLSYDFSYVLYNEWYLCSEKDVGDYYKWLSIWRMSDWDSVFVFVWYLWIGVL